MKHYPTNRQPSLISILNHGVVFFLNSKSNQITNNASDADTIFATKKRERNFEFLLTRLMGIINHNRTVDVKSLSRYLSDGGSIDFQGHFIKYNNS